MSDKPRTLYRPVGLVEMLLILEQDSRAFPSRKSDQPYFYPILTGAYAHQIARDWNTNDKASGYVGFVTKFEVEADYLEQFDEQTVGETLHKELWIPSDRLAEFNHHIADRIGVIAAYYGKTYEGARHEFRELAADSMFHFLYDLVLTNKHDFRAELMLNRRAIYVNYPYWIGQSYDDVPTEHHKVFLQYLADAWREMFPDWHLLQSNNVGSHK